MELGTKNTTDYLDAYCDSVVGHTNWAFAEYDRTNGITTFIVSPEVHSVVVIYNNSEEEEHV